jgi:7-cyano-7-deazaguanine reductase
MILREDVMDELRFLGKRANQPTDTLDLIPWKGEAIVVRLDCAEFTSLCPVTGQPDFAELIIEYVPDQFIAETKSVKLYLWKYRNEAAFNEQLIDTIASDLHKQIQPKWLRLIGRFHPRGGIAVTATAERGTREHRPT